MYVPGILSSQPSQVCLPSHGTVPERRANVQKGARPSGTDRRCSVPFRGSGGRRKDAGTRWLGCCPPERSAGETHPQAKRPMNRAKTLLPRRAAPPAFRHAMNNELSGDEYKNSRIVAAHNYFKNKTEQWLSVIPEAGGERDRAAEALERAVRDYLELVVIELRQSDDPHIIFETLNARGTPLLPSDMIKNQILHKAGIGRDGLEGAALLRWRPNQSLRRRRGRRQLDPSRRGEERRRVRWPTVLLSSATDGGLPLVLARFVRGLSTHQGSGCPRRLRTSATAAQCHRGPVDSHRVADQMPTGPSMSRRRAPHAASPLPRG